MFIFLFFCIFYSFLVILLVEININFSRKNKPFRDYHFDDVAFYSIINDTKIKIFKYEDIYFTEFIYNGVNFDIELQNVDKEELVVLLKSIIK